MTARSDPSAQCSASCFGASVQLLVVEPSAVLRHVLLQCWCGAKPCQSLFIWPSGPSQLQPAAAAGQLSRHVAASWDCLVTNWVL